VISIRL